MEPRLFDLDLQLMADSVLMIIAVLILFCMIFAPIFIIRVIRKSNKADSNNCPYRDNESYH